MKRPLSPSHNPENGVRLVEAASCPPSQPEQRMKREKKHQSFTLCEVCNIQLNSAAQAQIHYNGKSHQKRLKQLNKGKMPAAQGRSPSARSSLPKGCPCSGSAAALGTGLVGCSGALRCVLGICRLLVCLNCGGFPPPDTDGPQVGLGPESPRCCAGQTDTSGSCHAQVQLLVLCVFMSIFLGFVGDLCCWGERTQGWGGWWFWDPGCLLPRCHPDPVPPAPCPLSGLSLAAAVSGLPRLCAEG